MKVFPKISYVDQTRIQTSKKLVKTSEKIVEKQIAVNAQSIKWHRIWQNRLGGSRVSHVPLQKNDMKKAGTSRWSAVISACTVAASLDHRSQYMDGPPALLKGEKKEKEKRRSFTSSQMLHAHTHTPSRSRVNPERQEEGKSGHRRRAKGQNSAAGGNERTTSKPNLRGETDLAKRTWQKQSTHLSPTTHYGEAQWRN